MTIATLICLTQFIVLLFSGLYVDVAFGDIRETPTYQGSTSCLDFGFLLSAFSLVLDH